MQLVYVSVLTLFLCYCTQSGSSMYVEAPRYYCATVRKTVVPGMYVEALSKIV